MVPGYACGYPPYPGTAPPVGRKVSKILFCNSVDLRQYLSIGRINID